MQDSLFQIEAYFSTCMWFLAAIVILIVVIFVKIKSIHSEMEGMNTCMSNMCNNWLQTEDRTKKIEKGVEWFLERKGLKLDRSNISWEWVVIPIQQGHELDDAWKQIQMHREEIVYALYEANKRALEDHEKAKTKKAKKK